MGNVDLDRPTTERRAVQTLDGTLSLLS
jgi:hypothetical protein